MLATLKKQFVFNAPTGENRIFYLVRPPMLRINVFADGGQGPEKPAIQDEEIEEEVFTFPYPEERGDLSCIVNPPVEGIAGKVQSNKSESNRNLSVGTSDFLSYIFVNLDKGRAIENNKPEFVSLTTQSAIASYYTSLLVYEGYTANASFSYASNDVYEMPSSPSKIEYDGSNKPLYEARFAMSIFSEKVFYLGKEENRVHVIHSIQPRASACQYSIQETIDVQSSKFYAGNSPHQDNIGNSDLKLDIKSDYQTPELELHLIGNERLVSSTNNENKGNKLITPFLPEYSNTGLDIVLDRIYLRFNAVALPKYEGTPKYEVKLPLNLGFDDPLLRDRFIAKLSILASELNYQPIRLETRLPNSEFIAERYNITENGNSVGYRQGAFPQQIGFPKLKSIEFPILPEEFVFDTHNQTVYTSKTDKPQTPQSEGGNNSTQLSSVKEPVLDNLIAPQSGYRITQVDSISNHSLTQEITYEINEPATRLYSPDIVFEYHLLIGNIFSTKRGEQAYLRGVTYNAMSMDFALGSIPPQFTNRGNLEDIKPQASYHYTNYSNNTIPPNSDMTRSGLEKLVGVNYDNRRFYSSSTTNNLSNNYPLYWINTDCGVLDLITTSIDNPTPVEFSVGDNLEEAVGQEMELVQEEPNQNVQAEARNDNKADTGAVYEKSEPKEEQETEINESDDSSVSDLALTVGAVGLGILTGASGLFGALFKKGNDEEINPNKPNESLYRPKEGKVKKNCGDTSQCFADTIDWLEGKLKNPTFSDEEYESISQCYSEEIKNIQKAREYIKKREVGYSCNGALHHLFHHIGFTTEQEKRYKLRDYIRNGEAQEGFKLATTVTVGEELEGNYDIESIWADDEKGGQSEKVTLKKNSAYAQLDMGIRKQGYTPIWKMMSYIDTERGEKRSGLYLETIAELHLEAKELLGDKDEYGMKLAGVILLINDQEPGRGTLSMHDYPVKLSDRIDIVFKNDLALYYDDRQAILNKQINIGYGDYSEIEKSPEKGLEPILI